MTIKEKQHSGELYLPMDEEILREQLVYLDSLREYNEIPHVQMEKRREKLKEMFAEIGDECYVESPFYSNFGGRNVHFGNRSEERRVGKEC